MKLNVIVLPGDGIGPEVTDQAALVLEAVAHRYGHQIDLQHELVGGACVDAHGVALQAETLQRCRAADAVLLGAVGGPKWGVDAPVRPETGLLILRKELQLYANIRPVRVFSSLIDATPMRPERVEGVNLLFVRELTGGIYFGGPKRRWADEFGRHAVDTMPYSEIEIERILRVGFEAARRRRKKLTSVDKANVLECSLLWREIANELSVEYPDVSLEHQLVDAMAMHLIRRPRDFDVVVTENMFGDILSDESSMLVGSMGILPSASLGKPGTPGLYEPIHGSAPDIAGQGIANPIGTILSVALLLRYSHGLDEEAASVVRAVERVLQDGHRTADLAPPGTQFVRTAEMGRLVVDALD